MKKIFKYPLQLRSTIQEVEMPIGSKVLSTAVQGATICIWAEVDPEEQATEYHFFEIFGTGHPMDPPLSVERWFIGTVLMNSGAFVWHVYERRAREKKVAPSQ